MRKDAPRSTLFTIFGMIRQNLVDCLTRFIEAILYKVKFVEQGYQNIDLRRRRKLKFIIFSLLGIALLSCRTTTNDFDNQSSGLRETGVGEVSSDPFENLQVYFYCKIRNVNFVAAYGQGQPTGFLYFVDNRGGQFKDSTLKLPVITTRNSNTRHVEIVSTDKSTTLVMDLDVNTKGGNGTYRGPRGNSTVSCIYKGSLTPDGDAGPIDEPISGGSGTQIEAGCKRIISSCSSGKRLADCSSAFFCMDETPGAIYPDCVAKERLIEINTGRRCGSPVRCKKCL